MPWAGPNQISQDEIEGGVEITDSQYEEGLAALMEGRGISTANGFEVVDAPPEEVPEPVDPTAADYTRAVQLFLDTRAQEMGHFDANTLASYTTSSVTEWAMLARGFILWRDQVWTYANNQISLIVAEERDAPTLSNFILELPPVHIELSASATVIALAELGTVGGEVTGIDSSCGIGFAFMIDVGVFWLFFSTPEPDNKYLPFVQSPGVYVDVTARETDYLEVTVTDRATNEPTIPVSLAITVQRTR